MGGTLPADWESVSSSAIARFDADKPKVATRIANRDVLNAIAPHSAGTVRRFRRP